MRTDEWKHTEAVGSLPSSELLGEEARLPACLVKVEAGLCPVLQRAQPLCDATYQPCATVPGSSTVPCTSTVPQHPAALLLIRPWVGLFARTRAP